MNFAIYTNILTPYRMHFYNALYENAKINGDTFHVIVMAETEPNRNWNYNDLKKTYTILLKNYTIAIKEKYTHINTNLKQTLRKLNLDIIVCAGGYNCPGVWDVLRMKKKLGYKTFFWSESHLNESRNYNRLKKTTIELIRRSVYSKFDGFWYAGKMSLDFIKKYSMQNAEYYFMPNLVEEKKYKKVLQYTPEYIAQLKIKYGVPFGKVVMFCPARLSPVKGIDKFLPILSKVKNKDKIVFFIAGDGTLKRKIKMLANELQLDVRLLGYCEQDKIIDFYAISDYFVLPSLSDPNPLTCIEALWSGLPLFISKHCGNYPEVIKTAVNGYAFDYAEEKQTIENLSKLLSADSLWKENARNMSISIAEKNYNTVTVVEEVMQYFRQIVNS